MRRHGYCYLGDPLDWSVGGASQSEQLRVLVGRDSFRGRCRGDRDGPRRSHLLVPPGRPRRDGSIRSVSWLKRSQVLASRRRSGT